MALDSADTIADTSLHQDAHIFYGQVATGETATVDDSALLELRKVDQEKAGAEGTQQESTANLVTHSVGSSIIGPAVSSLCTTTAARHFVPSTSPVATSARDNVLEVPELLEAIILSLPVHDIFANAQRVSRTWNAVTRSPSIRTRLWLRSPINEVASPVDFLATPYENVQPSEHFPS